MARDNFYAVNVSQDKWNSIFGKAPEKIELCPGCPFEKVEKPCLTDKEKGRESCSFYHRLVKEGRV